MTKQAPNGRSRKPIKRNAHVQQHSARKSDRLERLDAVHHETAALDGQLQLIATMQAQLDQLFAVVAQVRKSKPRA
jgi:hypothetical protein